MALGSNETGPQRCKLLHRQLGCIQKCNQHRLPEKYWDYDDTTGEFWHGKDIATNTPIREQALLMLKDNTFNKHNTQYFKIANKEFEHWEQPLRDLFPQFGEDKMGISLFVQPPGSMHWSHVDTYTSFILEITEIHDIPKGLGLWPFLSLWQSLYESMEGR